jgi:hypothetical protein
MPTAPKLIAATLMGLTALLVAYTYSLGYPEQTFKKDYYMLAGGVGFVVGWYTLGQKPYFGGMDSIMAGIRANIIMSIVGAICFAFISVWNGMGEHAFNNPFQVPISWVMRSIAYFTSALTFKIWAILLIAGAVSGRLTGVANMHWR